MNLKEQQKFFEQYSTKMKEIMQSKGDDYANEDRLSNFKKAGMLGNLSAAKQCFTAITTKVVRLGELIDSKEPNNESIEDNIIDLSNYSVLLAMIVSEGKTVYDKNNPIAIDLDGWYVGQEVWDNCKSKKGRICSVGTELIYPISVAFNNGLATYTALGKRRIADENISLEPYVNQDEPLLFDWRNCQKVWSENREEVGTIINIKEHNDLSISLMVEFTNKDKVCYDNNGISDYLDRITPYTNQDQK